MGQVAARLEWTEDGETAAELQDNAWSYVGPTAQRLASALEQLPWQGKFLEPGDPEYLEVLRRTFKQSTGLRVVVLTGG